MFLEKAQEGKNNWFIYVITLVLAIIVYTVFQLPLMGYLLNQDIEIVPGANLANMFSTIEDKNLLLALLTIPFAGLFAGLYIGITTFHQKKLTSVLTGAKSFRWNRLFFAFICVGFLQCTFTYVSYLFAPEEFVVQFQPQKWIPLVFISLVFLGIQATTEELLFRCYFTQGVALLFSHRLFALVIPAVLFGLVHLGNPEVAEHGWQSMLPSYILMGLFFGIITLMDEGAELAIGFHIANNVFISLLLTTPEAVLQTNSILMSHTVQRPIDTFVAISVSSILFLLLFSFTYKWNNWSKLWSSIQPNEKHLEG